MLILSKFNQETFKERPKQPLAIFLPSLHDGGAEKMMLNLAIGIAEYGYLIDLVLAKAEGPHLMNIPESVHLVDLKASRIITSLPGLIKYMRNVRPRAILSIMNHANIVALLARRFSGVPTRILVSERNTLSVSVANGRTWSARVMPWLVKNFYPSAEEIIAVSKGVADDLAITANIPRSKIKVVYNPVVTSKLREQMSAPLDHHWFKPDQPPIILGVGRLVPQKDFATLIKAFALVHQTHKARLLILGEGPERSALEGLVRQLGLEMAVDMPGFVTNPYAYMSRASLFVLSSRWEGLPGVLIEALSCGMKVVSTDCPSGPREILADGKYGQLVSVGDEINMAHAIAGVLMEKVPQPPSESWQPFLLETVIDQYLDLLLGE